METFITEFETLEVREAADGHHELIGLVVPYNKITDRAGVPGRKEKFLPGAFASAPGAAAKIRLVDENHSTGRRPAGVALELEERSGGLFSRFRFYDTPEGRSAFENAREGTYGGLSAGFVAIRDRVVAGVREVAEARLHHVSLVDEPAYADARVLALRSATPGMTVDEIRDAERIQVDLDRYRALTAPRKVELAEVDDTPMSVRIRQLIG